PTALQTPPDTSGYAFASPRTWEYLSHLLTSCDLLGLTPAPRRKASAACWELIAGCLGDSLALTFGAYLRELRIPDWSRLPADVAVLDDVALYVLSQQLVTMIGTQQEASLQVYVDLVLAAHENGRGDWVADSLERLQQMDDLLDLLRSSRVPASAQVALLDLLNL
ncbi:MAG: hypothetical protein D6772_17535, partial [Bacteroidetes bacterium]